MGEVMSTDRPKEEQERRDAATLYATAIELEKRGDYHEARRYYEKSLRLYEDPAVREAYLKLLATIGPK